MVSVFPRSFSASQNEDARVHKMVERISALGGIVFRIEISGDGSWVAESQNLDGIITGSRDVRKMEDLIRDAIFTYFEIPPELCDARHVRPASPARMTLPVPARWVYA